MDLAHLTALLEHNAVAALLVVLLYALHKGWLVPRAEYDRLAAQHAVR